MQSKTEPNFRQYNPKLLQRSIMVFGLIVRDKSVHEHRLYCCPNTDTVSMIICKDAEVW